MDFQQGLITTIHEYGVTGNLLKELNKSLKRRSTSILIPCLYEEFERPALKDIKEANNYLKFIVKKEPENIFAWHLKGISHSLLDEPIYANLSAAEEFLRRRDFKNAKFFAEKVISATKKFSSENLRASDIINLINEI